MSDPRPGNEAFWATRAEHYEDLQWVRESGFLDLFLRLCDPDPKGSALDLGTGTGIVGTQLAPRMGRVLGIDISQDMLDEIASPPANFSSRQMDLQRLDLPDDSFDLATARMVFHHVEDGPRGMSEARRVLKRGGRMVLCEGVPPDWAVRERYDAIFRLKEERKTFFETDLINLFCDAGFENVVLHPYYMRQVSLVNWVENSGLPRPAMNEILRLHREADAHFKKVYRMTEKDGDIRIDWKFAIVIGYKW